MIKKETRDHLQGFFKRNETWLENLADSEEEPRVLRAMASIVLDEVSKKEIEDREERK